MTAQTLSQELYVPKASIFEAAMALETATCHLKNMIGAASERLGNIGPGQGAADLLDDAGFALSMLDAAEKYVLTITALNEGLYKAAHGARR